MISKISFALLLLAVSALVLPTAEGVQTIRKYFLSGDSGTFKYPLSGNYLENERVLIKLDVEQETLLTVDSYDIEELSDCNFDMLVVFKKGVDQTEDEILCGTSTTPRNYAIDANSGARLLFISDLSTSGEGFTISWSPLN